MKSQFVGGTSYEDVPYGVLVEDFEWAVKSSKETLESFNKAYQDFYLIENVPPLSEHTKATMGSGIYLLETAIEMGEHSEDVKDKKIKPLLVKKLHDIGTAAHRLHLELGKNYHQYEGTGAYIKNLPAKAKPLLQHGMYADLRDALGVLIDCQNMGHEAEKYLEPAVVTKVVGVKGKKITPNELPVKELECQKCLGKLCLFNDGSIQYDGKAVFLRLQLAALCQMFISGEGRVFNEDDIKDTVIGSKTTVQKGTVAKYISELNARLWPYYKRRAVVLNQSKGGWVFKP